MQAAAASSCVDPAVLRAEHPWLQVHRYLNAYVASGMASLPAADLAALNAKFYAAADHVEQDGTADADVG